MSASTALFFLFRSSALAYSTRQQINKKRGGHLESYLGEQEIAVLRRKVASIFQQLISRFRSHPRRFADFEKLRSTFSRKRTYFVKETLRCTPAMRRLNRRAQLGSRGVTEPPALTARMLGVGRRGHPAKVVPPLNNVACSAEFWESAERLFVPRWFLPKTRSGHGIILNHGGHPASPSFSRCFLLLPIPHLPHPSPW